jgi:hypothetical protein
MHTTAWRRRRWRLWWRSCQLWAGLQLLHVSSQLKAVSILKPLNVSHQKCSGEAEKWTRVSRFPLVHFSAQPEPFFSHCHTETTQRIPQNVLTLSQKVDKCEPLDVGGALEPYLDRLCPVLFPRLVDAKEAVRGLASAALAAVGDAHAADALLPALLRSLDFAKAPRAKTGVLEFALYVLSGQGGG